MSKCIVVGQAAKGFLNMLEICDPDSGVTGGVRVTKAERATRLAEKRRSEGRNEESSK